MTEVEVGQPRKPLPMWPIVRDACLHVWDRRQHFGRLLIIPTILSALISISISYWIGGKEPSLAIAALSFLLILPDFMVFTFFAVSCHRSVLLGVFSVGQYGVHGWSMRETRFYLWILGIYIVGYFFIILYGVALAVITFALAGSFGYAPDSMKAITMHRAYVYFTMALLSVPFAYVVGRMSLLLPAVAVDLRPNINSAWAQSEGNGWRVAILVGLIPLLFILLQVLFGILIERMTDTSTQTGDGEQWLGTYSIASIGLNTLLRYVHTIVEVAILSLTFKELSGWAPSRLPQPQES